MDDGLSHETVTSIQEDRNGFLWIGTVDGLNRFDGLRIKTYDTDNTAGILFSNSIEELALAPNGDLWIGTLQGLNVLDYESGQFFRIPFNSYNPQITEIEIVDDNNLWVSTRNYGMYKLQRSGDRDQYVFNIINHLHVGNGLLSDDITSLVDDDARDGLWIGSTQGLTFFQYKDQRFIDYEYISTPDGGYKYSVNAIAFKDQNSLWIATHNLGLIEFNVSLDQFIVYNNQDNQVAMPSNNITSIIQARDQTYWLALYGTGPVNCLQYSHPCSRCTMKMYSTIKAYRVIMYPWYMKIAVDGYGSARVVKDVTFTTLVVAHLNYFNHLKMMFLNSRPIIYHQSV